MSHTPKLTNDEWIVTGHEIIAWINDLQFFDITHDAAVEFFFLRLNQVATATVISLGVSNSVTEAIARARAYVNADDDPMFACEHGRDLAELCADCDDKPHPCPERPF